MTQDEMLSAISQIELHIVAANQCIAKCSDAIVALRERVGFRHHGTMFVRVFDVLTAVCSEYGVSLAVLKGHNNTRRIAEPRQVAAYLIRRICGKSLSEIGMAVGGFHHTTILYSIETVSARMQNDEQFRRRVESLASRFETWKEV